ncbi:MAG: hypothetical protein ACXIVQ_05845 [Acidimicrobiales bacterium]
MIKESMRWVMHGLADDAMGRVEMRFRGQVSVEPLKRAVAELGESIVMPPGEAFEIIEVCELGEVDGRPRVRVRMPVWTDGGASNLFVDLEVSDDSFPDSIKDLAVYPANEEPDSGPQRWEALAPTMWQSIAAMHWTDTRSISGLIGISANTLAAGDHEVVSRFSKGTLSEAEARLAVAELGEPLIRPPDVASEDVEVIVLDDDPLGRPHVRARFALWTADGPSELHLEQQLRHHGYFKRGLEPKGWITESIRLYRAGDDADDGGDRWERIGNLGDRPE